MRKIWFLGFFLLFFLYGCQENEASTLAKAISKYQLPASVDASMELPTIIEHDGQAIFIEWTSSDPSIFNFNGNVIRSNVDVEVTLTAKFTLGNETQEKSYKILVLAIGSDTKVIRTFAYPGEVFKIYYVSSEDNFPELITPTHSSATFLNWCLDEALTTPMQEPISLENNLDLYAKWDVIYYDVEVIYTGYKDNVSNQSVHLQQLNQFESYVEKSLDTEIVSLNFMFPTGIFNVHQVKQVLYVETVKKQFDIFYYQKYLTPVTFISTYIEQYDQNNVIHYGLTEDSHLYQVIDIGFETQYIDLGLISLAHDETILEIKTSSQRVYIGTSNNKVHVIELLYGMLGYQDAGVKTFDLHDYKLGDFIEFNYTSNQQSAMIVVCEFGIIDLTDPSGFPYVYKIEDETDHVKEVLFQRQDYFILTDKNQLYLVRNVFFGPSNAYGNITKDINLNHGEYVIDFLVVNNYVYLITSNGNAYHYASYVVDQMDQTTYGINQVYDLGLSSNEEIIDVMGNLIYTNQHNLYNVSLENGLSSPGIRGLIKITLPLNENEFVTDFSYSSNSNQDRPNLFITNQSQIIVYDRYSREYKRIDHVSLLEDEEILFYLSNYEEPSFFRLLTSTSFYAGYDFSYDATLIQSVLDELNTSKLFDLVMDGNLYQAITWDGQKHIKHDFEHYEKSVFAIWKIEDHYKLSKDAHIPLNIDLDPLIHKNWSLVSNAIEEVPNTASQDYNLYLYEVPHAYKLNYVTQTDQLIDSRVVEMNVGIDLPIPTETGKYFLGWFMDPELTELFHPDKVKPGNTYTLYAKWTNDKYSVYYHDIEGVITPTESKTGEAPMITSTIPVKPGYLFMGWYDENNVRYLNNNQARYEDLHLYARFNPISLQINLYDQENNLHFVNTFYDETLRDIMSFLYGYEVEAFYSDIEREHILDIDYVLTDSQTFYINLIPKDVSIILLEEEVIDGEYAFFFINQGLFAEYNDSLYMFQHSLQNEYQDEFYMINQPVNLTERLGFTRSQISGMVSFGRYALFIMQNKEVHILDTTEMVVVKTINLNLAIDEEIDVDSLFNFNVINEQKQFFIGLSSINKMYIFGLDGVVSIVSNVTELIRSSRYFIAVINDKPIAYHYVNGSFDTINLYRLPVNVGEQKAILRVASGITYKEVFEDGRILIFDYRLQDGSYQFIPNEENLGLNQDEVILEVLDKTAYTSSDRLFTFIESTNHQVIDLENKLNMNEKVISVGKTMGSKYVLTSQRRLLFVNEEVKILTLQEDETLIDVVRLSVITSKRIYEYDWANRNWLVKDVFLEGETVIKSSMNYGLTSLNRVFQMELVDYQEPMFIAFKLYQTKEIIKASFGSIPNLPIGGQDGFMGWYLDNTFVYEFENINSSNPIVLYPKYE